MEEVDPQSSIKARADDLRRLAAALRGDADFLGVGYTVDLELEVALKIEEFLSEILL